jgi:hypothetical protein
MVAPKLDLSGDNAIERGASFDRIFSVCNQPNLTDFQGYCEVKNKAGQVIATPSIIVLTPTTFSISLSHTQTASMDAGEYDYDVKFVSTNNRFFAARGKVQIIETITSNPP